MKIEGIYQATARGFGFLTPDGAVGRASDLFVPPRSEGGAWTGDRVSAETRPDPRDPQRQVAKVTAVLERNTRTLIGAVERRGRETWLQPSSDRYPNAVKVVGRSAGKLRPGDKIAVAVGSYGSAKLPPMGALKASFGRDGTRQASVAAILYRYDIEDEFPAPVRAAAALAPEEVDPAARAGRLDLRDRTVITIDGASSKDFDDAVSLERDEKGRWVLGVHIADVSHYVPAGSVLDLEAFHRGASVYFADRVVPMLPEELSNGVCSLNAGEDKLTFSALVWIDQEGNIEKYEFHKSVIHSKVRGVYSEVNALFDGTASKELKEKYAPVQRSLSLARKLAKLLEQKSRESGCVELESSEPEFTVDENGVCIDVKPHGTGESEQMIEQLMIMANRAAAMLAEKHHLPFVYRVHEKPNPDRVDSLADLVTALGLNAKPLENRGDIKTGDLAAIMNQAEGTPSERVISHQILRTMAKARYDTAPIGHFGLALADYCHFTSPIRRYPDTSIHRILSAWLETEDREACVARFQTFAQQSAAQSSDCEVRAMTAERSAEDCYMAEYMHAHLGEHYVGVISGVTMRGVFVQLPNTVEGFVPLESFTDAHYRFDGAVSQVDETTGRRLTIGQELPVLSASADVSSGRIDFVYDPQK